MSYYVIVAILVMLNCDGAATPKKNQTASLFQDDDTTRACMRFANVPYFVTEE